MESLEARVLLAKAMWMALWRKILRAFFQSENMAHAVLEVEEQHHTTILRW
jgi:hypothetical protein